MDAYTLFKAFAKAVLLPPAGPLFLSLFGLLLWRRAPRLGFALATAGTLTLLLLSLPVVAWLLTLSFDRDPLDFRRAGEAQAIVIIGGGSRRMAPEYDGDTLGRLTLERVRYGALVAKRTGLPVLVSGGTPAGGSRSEADLMADALTSEFGIPVRWREAASRNTHENARYSARMLKQDGVVRAILVAHAIDMPRATAEFAGAGLSVTPAPTGLASAGGVFLTDFVPQVGALVASRDALYEMLANAARFALP